MTALVNLLAMQAAWFACVLGAAHDRPWIGVAVSLLVVAQHVARHAHRPFELKLVLCALLMGLLLDSALARSHLIEFTSGIVIEGFTTPWMLGLWIAFATTLTDSLKWLMARPLLAVLFGAVGGPLAYWSGARLGALTLVNSTPALIAIAACWALAMGIFVVVVRARASRSALAAA